MKKEGPQPRICLEFVVELDLEEILSLDLGHVVDDVLVVQKVGPQVLVVVETLRLKTLAVGNLDAVDLADLGRVGLGLADALAAVGALGQLLDVVGVVPLVHVAQGDVAKHQKTDVVRTGRLETKQISVSIGTSRRLETQKNRM